MDANEQDQIYDIMRSIAEYSAPLCDLINSIEDRDIREIYSKSYRDGVYSAAIRLQIMLPEEATERGKLRHEKMLAEIKAYFATSRPNKQMA